MRVASGPQLPISAASNVRICAASIPTFPSAAAPLQTTPPPRPPKHSTISPDPPSAATPQNRSASASTHANLCLRRQAQSPPATYSPPAYSSSPHLLPTQSASSPLPSTPPSSAPNS